MLFAAPAEPDFAGFKHGEASLVRLWFYALLMASVSELRDQGLCLATDEGKEFFLCHMVDVGQVNLERNRELIMERG